MKIKHWSATRVIAFGFALIIIAGALLLRLPAAGRGASNITFLDALFTSASATCVTGLAGFDTWTRFAPFGQAILLVLIQIGGLGFITIAMLFPLLNGRRIGLRERDIIAEAVGTMQLGGVIRLVRRTLFITFALEFTGMLLLSIRFIPMFGLGRGIWFSAFHSVSAFCNAGFDLMGCLEPGSSLTRFANDPLVLLTVAALIIAGGIGFVVWNDLIERRLCPKAFALHTRVVLLSTLFLLILGTAFFCFSERNAQIGEMTGGTRLLASFFQAVTPRTAGFNALDTAELSDAGKAMTIFLMFIGAAPGGTGGGVKITTAIVLFAATAASLHGYEDAAVAHFRLSSQTQRRAFCNVTLYLGLTAAAVVILCLEGQPLSDALFECFSAIGTVGLSTGITAGLSPLSKLAVIILMYAGRIGSISVFLAVSASGRRHRLKDPIGKIIVG